MRADKFFAIIYLTKILDLTAFIEYNVNEKILVKEIVK